MQNQIMYGDQIGQKPPQGCEKQEAFCRKSGILMLSKALDKYLVKELPDLGKAYEDFSEANLLHPSDEVLNAVDNKWATNITMVDLD